MPTFFYDQFKSTRGKIRHIQHADLAVGLPIKQQSFRNQLHMGQLTFIIIVYVLNEYARIIY